MQKLIPTTYWGVAALAVAFTALIGIGVAAIDNAKQRPLPPGMVLQVEPAPGQTAVEARFTNLDQCEKMISRVDITLTNGVKLHIIRER